MFFQNMGDRANIPGTRPLYVYNDRESHSKGIESLDFGLMKSMSRTDTKLAKRHHGE